MKRALRNTDTSMFIRSDGGETTRIDQARSFANYDEAVEFCKNKPLKNVELVLKMEDNSEFAVAVASKHLSA